VKSRSAELTEKADKGRTLCTEWLTQIHAENLPKLLAKKKLRKAAIRELEVSKNSFDHTRFFPTDFRRKPRGFGGVASL
jgi:hypothetical protein